MSIDSPEQTPPANIELQRLDWAKAKPLAKPIRTTVFIQEQQVPESEEWDNEDKSATQLLVIKDGKTVATARLTQTGKIGRMAVLKAYRKQGIGSMMLNSLIDLAKQQGQQQIKLWSQTHAQGFYQKHGFVAHGNEFLDAGIPHIEMHFKIN